MPAACERLLPAGTRATRFGTDTEEIVAGCAKNLAYSDVRRLAHALDAGTAITVEYVAASGNRTVRTLSELVLDPRYLCAWCHLRDDERGFALSRIHGVMAGWPVSASWRGGRPAAAATPHEQALRRAATTIADHGLGRTHRAAEAVDEELDAGSAQAVAVPVRAQPVPAGRR
ncbi:WYL domain-containing protein [Streptomyces californicus]|uniref:WYL domain-containing protein n=1 Tax=Streptomyces californicus TaxID=67351 RepID=UPI0037FB6326